MNKNININKQIVARLFLYRNFLRTAQSIGIKSIYSRSIAEASGVSSEQVRKDFSICRLKGNKRAGYEINFLVDKINSILGKKSLEKVIIVGAGNLGKALMRYEGFEKEGLEIEALFDNYPLKIDKNAEIPILPVEEIYSFVRKNNILLGVIAVPYFSAQQILDLMVLSGIKGVLNFSPISLKAPRDIFIKNINLSVELEALAYFIKR
jgi:redox-sensing transcriptional repressor